MYIPSEHPWIRPHNALGLIAEAVRIALDALGDGHLGVVSDRFPCVITILNASEEALVLPWREDGQLASYKKISRIALSIKSDWITCRDRRQSESPVEHVRRMAVHMGVVLSSLVTLDSHRGELGYAYARHTASALSSLQEAADISHDNAFSLEVWWRLRDACMQCTEDQKLAFEACWMISEYAQAYATVQP